MNVLNNFLARKIYFTLLAGLCVLAVSGSVNAAVITNAGGQYVWTQLVGSGDACVPTSGSLSCAIGSIGGVAGESIRIVKVGIGGDADAMSGDARFRLAGGGLDFTWTSGQQAVAATYDLGATPSTLTSGRGFTYSPTLGLTALDGASLQIFWNYQFDFDGRFTSGTDLLGNVFEDSSRPSSIRAWVQFERISNVSQEVPEPITTALIGLGLLGVAMGRRRKR